MIICYSRRQRCESRDRKSRHVDLFAPCAMVVPKGTEALNRLSDNTKLRTQVILHAVLRALSGKDRTSTVNEQVVLLAVRRWHVAFINELGDEVDFCERKVQTLENMRQTDKGWFENSSLAEPVLENIHWSNIFGTYVDEKRHDLEFRVGEHLLLENWHMWRSCDPKCSTSSVYKVFVGSWSRHVVIRNFIVCMPHCLPCVEHSMSGDLGCIPNTFPLTKQTLVLKGYRSQVTLGETSVARGYLHWDKCTTGSWLQWKIN